MSFSTWPGFRPGHRWQRESEPSTSGRPVFRRQLGMLEAKFDQATQRDGQSDTFVRLNVALAPAGSLDAAEQLQRAFLGRMLFAWAAARARHPLLAATIHDARLSSGEADFATVPPREFRYSPPLDEAEAFSQARATFLHHAAPPGDSLAAAMNEVQDRYILNDQRVLLDQANCLARLVLITNSVSPLEIGFFLVISHVISDGLSVFKLAAELFTLVSTAALPTPPPVDLLSLTFYLSGDTASPAVEVPLRDLAQWQIVPPADNIISLLPLANEEHYPVIPFPSPPLAAPAVVTVTAPRSAPPPPAPSPEPSLARQRWFWAIHRVLIRHHGDRYPRTHLMPRLAYPDPPIQARTRWPQLRFSRETSSRLLAFCKANGISPSMLLYSLISLSISCILATEHPTAPYQPVVIGFPFSLRPFLLSSPSPDTPPRVVSSPATDLAIRITFGQIHLPNSPLDPSDPDAGPSIRAAALRGAKLAKEQFRQRLDPERRSLFIAEAYSLVLQRLMNGTGHNPIPYPEPKTALNASMIGDVDRLLPTSFPFPSSSTASSTPISFRLSSLLIGTRLHRGEGMLMEALTWDGQITLCLGVDDQLVSAEVVERLLGGVRELGEVLVREEVE
ncbi:hypothetical protein JCM10207_006027 [Rhodosporidiobolus poonsookiae]